MEETSVTAVAYAGKQDGHEVVIAVDMSDGGFIVTVAAVKPGFFPVPIELHVPVSEFGHVEPWNASGRVVSTLAAVMRRRWQRLGAEATDAARTFIEANRYFIWDCWRRRHTTVCRCSGCTTETKPSFLPVALPWKQQETATDLMRFEPFGIDRS